MAHSYFYLDGYDEALSWANKVMQELPESHSALRIAAASAALAGQDDVAQQMGARLQEVDPSFRVSGLKSVLGPYQKSEFLNKYAEALRKAGLPH
jgi:adenylate cyclase